MHNSETILRCLDEHLSSNVELTLYGRAALDLSFPDEDLFRGTLDVDVILPLVEISAIDANEGFWNALERTNEILAPRGLYLTHLFPEDQVILHPDWLRHRVRLSILPLKQLRLWRPSLPDLVLTKMMRVDPVDREDLTFLLGKSDIPKGGWSAFFDAARSPNLAECHQAFRANRVWIEQNLLS